MTVLKKIEGDKATLDVSGRIDTVTSPQLEEEVQGALDEGVKNIIFNFEHVDYISSAGLRVILGAQKRVNEFCGTVTVKGANKDILEIFEMTGFIDILNIE